MSRSVYRPEGLSVPVCPTVPALWLTRETSDREVGIAPLPNRAESLRPSLPLVLWLIRSCFYLKERFTLEPAKHDSVVKVLTQVYYMERKMSSVERLGERVQRHPNPSPNRERAFIPAFERTGLSAPISVTTHDVDPATLLPDRVGVRYTSVERFIVLFHFHS